MDLATGVITCSLSGCQQEGPVAPTGSPTYEVNVTPRVQAFIANSHETSGPKDGGLMTTDSTEWYVEAALNYSFTNLAQAYNDQLVDTVSISIPLVNGEVQEEQAGGAYETLGALINAHNVPNTSHVAVVDVTTVTSGESMEITAVSVIGSGYDKGAPNTNYGPNDYWWWGLNGNYCGCGPNNDNYGKCADKQIQNRINFGINGGYYMYWTNVESWELDPWGYDDAPNKTVGKLSHSAPIGPNNPVSGDGVHDYLTYAGDEGGCLAPTDMQFYTQGTYDLAMIVRNTYVPTKDLASCTVIGDLPLGSGNQFHWVTYRYGKLAKTQH